MLFRRNVLKKKSFLFPSYIHPCVIVRKGSRLASFGEPVAVYLHSGFSQIDFECQLLSGVDVRVVRLSENPLQLLQLGAGERGPDAPLLSLLVQSAVIREELVGNCKRNKNVTVRRAVVWSVLYKIWVCVCV